jgi:hypothetical protein
VIQRAVEDKTTTAEVDDCVENTAGDYCSIDRTAKKVEKRSLGEMEAEFIEALSSFYYDGKAKLTVSPWGRAGAAGRAQGQPPHAHARRRLLRMRRTSHDARPPPAPAQDEEFDLLKEELLWNGSKVAVLDSNEQRFLEAQRAYTVVSSAWGTMQGAGAASPLSPLRPPPLQTPRASADCLGHG